MDLLPIRLAVLDYSLCRGGFSYSLPSALGVWKWGEQNYCLYSLFFYKLHSSWFWHLFPRLVASDSMYLFGVAVVLAVTCKSSAIPGSMEC